MSGSLTGPQYGGLVPGGPIGQQLQFITRRAVIPAVYVQIYQSHPLLSLLFANAQRARGGVSMVTIPIQGAAFTQFSWGSFAGDFPMPVDQAAIFDAQFNLKLGMIPIGFFGMEALVQSSEVIIPKLRVVMSDAAVVLKKSLAASLYTNNSATPNVMDSLVQAYDDGTNVTSYGGISRVGTGYFNGQYYPNPIQLTTRQGMAIWLTQIMTGAGGESVDFVVMNPAQWAALMSDFMGLEMFQSTARSQYGTDDHVNAGFRALRVLDTPIFSDPYCPFGQVHAINSRYLALYISEFTSPMVFSGFESQIPNGQIANIGVLISALDLVCAKPSSGAYAVNVPGGAWPNTLATPVVV